MPTAQRWCVVYVRVGVCGCYWISVRDWRGSDTQWREGTVCGRENSLVKRWAGYAEK